MTAFMILLGILLLLAGVLAFLLPEQAWRELTSRGSRWSNQASTAGLLIFAGIGWLGLMLMIVYGGSLWLGWRSEKWVQTPGTVIESSLVAARQVRSTNPAWRAHVVYQYDADGREQRGTRVDFAASSTGDRAWVEELLRTRYAPGATVDLWVNPGDSSQSVLTPGAPPKAAILSALGAVLLLVSIFQLLSLFRDWHGDALAGHGKRKPGARKKR